MIQPMSSLKFQMMTSPHFPKDFSCGVSSVDDLIASAFSLTMMRQGKAYNILVDDEIVGSCMFRFSVIKDENDEYYSNDHAYPVVEIVYIAVDKRIQHRKIGTMALDYFISLIKSIVSDLPVRFIVLNAFNHLEKWYNNRGFRPVEFVKDDLHPDTKHMRMDLLDHTLVDQYIGQLS